MCSGRSTRSRASCARPASPRPCVSTCRSLARQPPRARLRRTSTHHAAEPSPSPFALPLARQQNVDIMLQNLDKTEALENKSADLANQAKTCAAQHHHHRLVRVRAWHWHGIGMARQWQRRAPPPPPPPRPRPPRPPRLATTAPSTTATTATTTPRHHRHHGHALRPCGERRPSRSSPPAEPTPV